MRRVGIIFLMALAVLLIELVLFNIFGRWFKPNLLIILIVFVNLYLGIRWSLGAAVICGLIKDSLSVGIFGTNVFSFVVCAFMTTIIRRYYYQVGSESSRIMTIFLVAIINIISNYIIIVMFGSISFGEVLTKILFPEVLATVLVASYVFNKLKATALKLTL